MNDKTTSNIIPLIQTGQALQSLRDSGHNLPTALGEPTDNSIEAGANNIAIWLYEGINDRNKKHVHRIAIADDGSGMDADLLHHYLVLGYSTRYMSKTTIGKYGVGAKLAALNFCTHIQVWSRTSTDSPWLKVEFDLDGAIEQEKAGQPVGVSPPVESDIPDDLKEACPFEKGTLVVWSKVDRLEEGRLARNFDELRLEVEKELSRMFRYFIDGGRSITVNNRQLIAHDPLMLMEESWADRVLSGAVRAAGKSAKKPKKVDIKHCPARLIGDEAIRVNGDSARLRVTLYPPEVTRTRGSGGDQLAKQLRVPDNEGSISFVRLNREVSYTNVPRMFGRAVQPADRFIGIEVSFTPELDDFFGIRNVKRGVEPHGELRRKLRDLIAKHLKTARALLDEAWGDVAREEREHTGEHGAVTEAVKDADKALPAGQSGADKTEQDVDEALRELAKDMGIAKDEEVEEYVSHSEDLPFVVESVDFPGKMFIQTTHLPNKVIVRINTRHRFYKDVWEPLAEIADRDAGSVSGEEAVRAARRSVEALTLLLIAYGKAESMDHNPGETYEDLLMFWGQFLSSLMSKVKGVR